MKKCFAGLVFLFLLLAGIPVAAATAENGNVAVELLESKAVLRDSEGEIQAETEAGSEDDGRLDFTVTPGQTYYLSLGASQESTSMLQSASDASAMSGPVTARELSDSTLFKLRNEKSGSGAGLVSAAQYNEKALGDSGRCSWLQFVVANTSATEELKAVCNLTFSARRDEASDRYAQGDSANLTVTLYIQTPAKGDGENSADGERSLYHPEPGRRNEKVWDDVAKLSFTANSDPDDIDVSLLTGGEAYRDLADFSNAEIFVRDFTGSPVFEGRARAMLTLLNPWEARGDDSPPDPAQCKIYERDSSGRLSDVTALFTYGKDDGNGCWQMRVRQLGCYILSDQELDLSGGQI